MKQWTETEDRILDIMEEAKGANLSLFGEYYYLADEYKRKGELELSNYWYDRAVHLSRMIRKMDKDVRKLRGLE